MRKIHRQDKYNSFLGCHSEMWKVVEIFLIFLMQMRSRENMPALPHNIKGFSFFSRISIKQLQCFFRLLVNDVEQSDFHEYFEAFRIGNTQHFVGKHRANVISDHFKLLCSMCNYFLEINRELQKDPNWFPHLVGPRIYPWVDLRVSGHEFYNRFIIIVYPWVSHAFLYFVFLKPA